MSKNLHPTEAKLPGEEWHSRMSIILHPTEATPPDGGNGIYTWMKNYVKLIQGVYSAAGQAAAATIALEIGAGGAIW
jgi:hypothetical protein